MKKIDPARLVPMDIFVAEEPITIDIVYSKANHPRNIFKEAIYHDKARLWLEYDMARITILAARKLNAHDKKTLVLKDGLRTTEAQEAMQQTQIVKDHPEWMKGEYRLLSPVGHGAHPRGMAIDVGLLDRHDNDINMGTAFDEMVEQSARNYLHFPSDILKNRALLETAFVETARQLDLEILPLPSEWWDYRFPACHYNQYAPLSDSDLPLQMRMVSTDGPAIPDCPEEHFEALKNDILRSLN